VKGTIVGIRSNEVGQTEKIGVYLLLSQARYPLSSHLLLLTSHHYNIITNGVGIGKQEQGVGMIAILHGCQERLGLTPDALLLIVIL
jgi:hypothetical protein